MQMHASCAARHGRGVLVLGPSGAGKSSLILRLIGLGFMLVADDRVDVADGIASPPAPLAGLLEVRGIGILRLPFLRRARLSLAIQLGRGDRLPGRSTHAGTGLPAVTIDAGCPAAPLKVRMALAAT